MPILQGAQEVFIDGCSFQDVRGNYFDYSRATSNGTSRQPANGSEHTRVAGQVRQTSRSIPGPRQPNFLPGFENPSSWVERLQGTADAGPEAVFSQIFGNAANSPPSSRSPQNNPFNNNQYKNAAGAVNGGPSASPQTPEHVLAGGRPSVAPAPNGSFPPNPAGAVPSNSRANSGTSAFISDLSYTGSFTTTNDGNAEAWQAKLFATPAGWQSNSQGPQFHMPNNIVNSPPQSFQIRNSSTPSLQSPNNTNSSTLPSQSPNNTRTSTESFQHLSRNASVSEVPAEAPNGGRATTDSTPPERSTSRSPPLHMSPEQSTAELPTNARGSADTNNEALAKAPKEKAAGFLGF